MDVQVQGSGGEGGWPAPGCQCASCQRARSSGISRAPASVTVDGTLLLTGRQVRLATGRGWDEATERERAGYRVSRLAGGWDVTAPDGTRLLCAAGSDAAPAVPAGTARYDMVLLDLLGDPAQLGRLRAQGAVTAATLPVLLFADHRIRSERELQRRAEIWQAVLPRDGSAFTVPVPNAPAVTNPRPLPCRVLVLGGARSGKSEEAELRVAAEPAVMYLATSGSGTGDDDWAARIAAHRARRPSWWQTVESTDLAGALRKASGAVLVDSITGWLTAAMDECGAWDGSPAAAGLLARRVSELVAAWRQASAYIVAVSDETGQGIVPETPAGRLFRDELGRLNQILAAQSDEFIVVVAGRAMALDN